MHDEPQISPRRSSACGLLGEIAVVESAAYRLYVQSPETADGLKARFSGAHKLLYNKYFVDEVYDATFIKGTMKSSLGLWTFDRRVVDGVVNGTGWFTVFASWVSSLFDR